MSSLLATKAPPAVRFPDLKATLEIARQQLEATDGPISVSTDGRDRWFVTARHAQQCPESRAYTRAHPTFPLAIERGSQGQLIPHYDYVHAGAESPRDLSLRMMASVLCAEDEATSASDRLQTVIHSLIAWHPSVSFGLVNPRPSVSLSQLRAMYPHFFSGRFDPITLLGTRSKSRQTSRAPIM